MPGRGRQRCAAVTLGPALPDPSARSPPVSAARDDRGVSLCGCDRCFACTHLGSSLCREVQGRLHMVCRAALQALRARHVQVAQCCAKSVETMQNSHMSRAPLFVKAQSMERALYVCLFVRLCGRKRRAAHIAEAAVLPFCRTHPDKLVLPSRAYPAAHRTCTVTVCHCGSPERAERQCWWTARMRWAPCRWTCLPWAASSTPAMHTNGSAPPRCRPGCTVSQGGPCQAVMPVKTSQTHIKADTLLTFHHCQAAYADPPFEPLLQAVTL